MLYMINEGSTKTAILFLLLYIFFIEITSLPVLKRNDLSLYCIYLYIVFALFEKETKRNLNKEIWIKNPFRVKTGRRSPAAARKYIQVRFYEMVLMNL